MIAPNEIDIDLVNEWLRYDPESGSITWAKSPKYDVKEGDTAGGAIFNGCGNKYLIIKLKQKRYLAHRVAFAIFSGRSKFGFIDHINGDGLDNRIGNLRLATNAENSKNMKLSKRSKTGVMGVCFVNRSKNWRVTIGRNGKLDNPSFHNDFFEAVCRRKSLENKHNFHENHGAKR